MVRRPYIREAHNEVAWCCLAGVQDYMSSVSMVPLVSDLSFGNCSFLVFLLPAEDIEGL